MFLMRTGASWIMRNMGKIISRKDVAARIAEQTGVSCEEAEKVLRALGPVLSEALAEGKEIRFPRLARFLVKERGGDGVQAPTREVVAQVSTLFREHVLGPTAARVMALLEAKTDADLIEILERLHADGACKLTLIPGPSLPDGTPVNEFLLLGEHLSQAEYRFLAHEIKLDPEQTRTSVMRVVPEGTDPYAVDTLTVIPDEILEKPIDSDTVESFLRAAFGAGAQANEYLQQLAIRVPSKEGMTEAVMEVLDRLGGLTPLGDRRASELVPALREAVEGAMQVGNRLDPSKYVDITVLVDDEKIAVVIKDEGPAPKTREEWPGAREGSGIASMIMKRGADEVEYLPPGNRVMLTKYY